MAGGSEGKIKGSIFIGTSVVRQKTTSLTVPLLLPAQKTQSFSQPLHTLSRNVTEMVAAQTSLQLSKRWTLLLTPWRSSTYSQNLCKIPPWFREKVCAWVNLSQTSAWISCTTAGCGWRKYESAAHAAAALSMGRDQCSATPWWFTSSCPRRIRTFIIWLHQNAHQDQAPSSLGLIPSGSATTLQQLCCHLWRKRRGPGRELSPSPHQVPLPWP